MRRRSPSQQNGKLAVILAIAVLALTFGSGIAQADDQINESGKASPNGLVYIENLAGSIKVKGWDKNEIEVTGTLDEKAKRLNFETGKKKSVIEVVYPRRVKNIQEGSYLVIMVPHGSRLAIEGISADIEISGVTGAIHSETISGDVWLKKVGKKVRVECVSGNVQARGNVSDISVEVVNGDITLDFDRFLNLSVEAVSGDIEVSGDLDVDGSFELDVHSGNITLTLPGDVSADFETSSFSGDISTEFGYMGDQTSKYLPGQELNFSLGDGDAEVEINTFSGDITINKR